MRRLRTDEQGFTLTELMVAVMLLAVIGSAAIGGLISTQRALNGVTLRDAELGQARVAINSVERQLRSAMLRPGGSLNTPFETFTDDRIVFYTAANAPRDTRTTAQRRQGPIPKLVEIWVQGGQLLERVTEPGPRQNNTWTYPSPGPARVLASNVAPGPVFTGFCDRARPDRTCSQDGRAQTEAVAVGLRIRVEVPGGSQVTELTSRARLVNLELT